MISRFSVAGFKSLEDFSLKLQPGLNVLVGPNGSGKTNIVRFLEFVSFLSDGSLVEAVSRSGGAGDIFSKNLDGSLKPRITFTVSGSLNYDTGENNGFRKINYELYIEIDLSISKGTLEFRQQKLDIYDFSGDNELDLQGDMTAIRSLFRATYFSRSTGNSHLSSSTIRDEKILQSYFTQTESPSLSERLNQYLRDGASLNDVLITSFLSNFTRLSSYVNADLDVGQPLNIIPSEVKTEDIASRAGISSSGRGFAATLHFSKKYNISNNDQNYYFNSNILTTEDLSLLIEYCKLVNDNVLDIRAEVDTLQNIIKTTMSFVTENGVLDLPLSSVSDGTAKWLALVACILTRRSIFMIEEPENFLHPHMQREIIDIIRSRNTNFRRSFLLSSHSETLINCLKPTELVIVEFVDGKTLARRVKNSNDILFEINKTGFGLSYYYLSGALS